MTDHQMLIDAATKLQWEIERLRNENPKSLNKPTETRAWITRLERFKKYVRLKQEFEP